MARCGLIALDCDPRGIKEAAAERFAETVAFGPGAWATLPPLVRETFIRNAPTFLDETHDPDGLNIELGPHELKRRRCWWPP
ncbi:MAG: hypothetical protein KGJ86_14275 [Chloroflexota bacterium]|nr:hypothetical protein [Chloroflexota bacterium]